MSDGLVRAADSGPFVALGDNLHGAPTGSDPRSLIVEMYANAASHRRSLLDDLLMMSSQMLRAVSMSSPQLSIICCRGARMASITA